MSKTRPTQEKPQNREAPQQKSEQRAQKARQPIESQRGSQLVRRPQREISPWGASAPFTPYSFMRRISDEMDRLFGEFAGFGPSALGWPQEERGVLGRGAWAPQVEVFEREGKLVVCADLPGLKKDDVSVDIDENAITIQGERRQEREEKRAGYYVSERSYGSFHRTIPLPEGISAENAKATFRDGVLEIELDAPKRERGRRLDIQEAT
jgi:HSP20 family protein